MVLGRRSFVVLAAAFGVILARRDLLRRQAGLKRRTPQAVLVQALWRLNTRASRALSRYFQKHTTISYLIIFLGIYFIGKYNIKLRRLWRAFRWNRTATKDVLTEYPSEEPDGVPTLADAGSRPLRRARSEAHLKHGSAMATAAQSHKMPEHHVLVFLEMLQHLIQGVDEDVTASLYEKMKRVKVASGEELFHQGDPATGMWVVVKGSIGVRAEDDLTILNNFEHNPPCGGMSSGTVTPLTKTASLSDLGSEQPPSPGLSQTLSASVSTSGTSAAAGVGAFPPTSSAPSSPIRRAESTSASVTDEDSVTMGYGFGPAALRGPQRRSSKPPPLLAEFGLAKSVGENALLSGDGGTHPVTCFATQDSECLVMDASLFQWFKEEHPQAFTSFVLTTTSRQWRVAYVTLVDILGLPGAWHAAIASSEPVFSPLTTELCATIVKAGAGTVVKGPGDALYSEGDAAECLYVLLEGKATCFMQRNGQSIVTRDLTPGCTAGGLSGFVGLPHRDTVRCQESCVFAIFPMQLFQDLAGHCPLKGSPRIETLMHIVFAVAETLTPLLRLFLHLGLQRMWLQSGDTLFREGDPCTGLYVVISGRLRTATNQGPTASSMQRSPAPHDAPASSTPWFMDIARGETVGEMTVLMSAQARECDAVCVRDCELVAVSRASFARIMERYPTVMKHFTQLLAKRYQDLSQRVAASALVSTPRVKPNYVTIAIVPAGGSPPHLGHFATQFAKALCTHGSVVHINSEKVDAVLGHGICGRMDTPFGRARVTQWISTQEESHRYLVFEADADVTPWSRICVEHADCILLVGTGHTSPELSAIERECVFQAGDCPPTAQATRKRGFRRKLWDLLDGAHATQPITPSACKARSFSRKELVLLHPVPTRRPAGTRSWLRLRRVGWHHHVRVSYVSDFGRVARHVSGNARGLVLGGGGARGLAHIGVFRALEERGMDIDLIGGTSQGAFMAAAYASTMNLEAAQKKFDPLAKIASPWLILSSLTFPIVSYFEGSSFNEVLREAFGDTQIEDLWIRYFCITTNVSKSCMQVHTTGPLWKYCRASMTVLGLLPPMYDNGSLLVDGGYQNNLPVDVMRNMAPQMSEVIASDVENKDTSMYDNVDDFGNSLSGWWVLGKLLLSKIGLCKPLKLPSMSSVTLSLCYMSHTINIRALLQEGLANDSIIYIQPDVQHYNLLDYHKRAEIVNHGEVAARTTLQALKERQEQRDLLEETSSEDTDGNLMSLHRFSLLNLHGSGDHGSQNKLSKRRRALSTPDFGHKAFRHIGGAKEV